jgi:sec-independent protein translocase protein TatA
MFSGLESPMHLLVVLVVALLVLGPKRLPGAGRALGSGIREFRDSVSGHDSRPPDKSSDVERES